MLSVKHFFCCGMDVYKKFVVANIALSSVLSDTFGKSATAIVDYFLTCDVFDPEYCKSLLLTCLNLTTNSSNWLPQFRELQKNLFLYYR